MAIKVQEINAIEQLQIDAFCSGPFTGNPAAVVFDHFDVSWMQKLGNENNLAETAFLRRVDSNEENNHDEVNYRIRWFTPNKEVDLCGHATLAAAHALYETTRVQRDKRIVFHTMTSGNLICKSNKNGSISLDFPATPPSTETITSSDRALVLLALGIAEDDLIYLGRTTYDVFAEISRKAFAELNIPKDVGAVVQLGGRGLIITTRGRNRADYVDITASASRGEAINNPTFDFLSRCFFPL